MVVLKDEEILVTCNYKDLKQLRKDSSYTVVDSEFNTDTQVGEVILRPFTWRDL